MKRVFQRPNPLDLIFFAYDSAAERLALPRGFTNIIWELDGQLDCPRLVEAVRGLHAIYPVTAARLEIEMLSGRPRWRLGSNDDDAERAVVIESADDDTPAARAAWYESLPLRTRDLGSAPPLSWIVRRVAGRGDVCVLRYPHALMDARAGLWIHEVLDRIHDERPAIDSLRSAGDESLPDFAPLLDGLSAWKRTQTARLALRHGESLPSQPRRLVSEAMPLELGPLRGAWRHLTPVQTVSVRDNSDRLCGVGRIADYVRACALRALHELMPANHGGSPYTLLNVFERRNRRQSLRQICNLSTSVPIVVPAAIATNVRAVADAIREQTGERLTAGIAVEHACALWLLTRLPTRWLGAATARRLRPRPGTPGPSRRFGLAPPPSLPLGLIGQTSRPMHTFCGVPVSNYHGFSPPLPDNGFALTVNMTDTRLNLSIVWYENRLSAEQAGQVLDGCVARLLDAGGGAS